MLGRLVRGMWDPDYGSQVSWTDDEGLYLTYYGSFMSGPFTSEGFISLDRVRDSRNLVTYNPERCIVTTDEAGQTGLSGSAICRGLEWADYFGAVGYGPPPTIPGEPAFDADITFEAH